MSRYQGTWSLCGGWAVDAWLGRQTRDHGDLDISVFVLDQRALFEHLPGWQLLAHDPIFDVDSPGSNAEWWDGRRPLHHTSHIHARPPELRGPVPEGGIALAKDGFALEFQFNKRSGNEWVLSREPLITLPLRRCIRPSLWGVPTLAPEAVLFYKATAYFGIEEQMTGGRLQDEPDFLALLPHLIDEQRQWLRESIALLHPDHPWLSQLSA
ncbi:MAG: hypothetical protein WBD55_12290 [Dehalococcoidia bacterium]